LKTSQTKHQKSKEETMIRTMLRNRKGQGLVEYALILALVAIVVIAAVTLLGGNINTTLTNIAGAL